MLKTENCPYCGKAYSRYGLGTHIWKNHGDGKSHDPNRGYKNGRVVWNKGLSKDTNDSLQRSSKLMSGRSPWMKGKTHTEEAKLKMSESAKKAFDNGIHATWKTRKNLQSYPEEYTERKLKDANCIDFVKEYPITVTGKKTTYFLDFYFEKDKIDLEIDGGTHRFSKIQEKDKNRDAYLKSIGITVIRIPWSDGKEFDDALTKFIKSRV
jgi:very-short-patch-repair endonuclease